jgi:hypothetical protein
MAAPVQALELQRSEVLGFGAVLPHEAAGLRLGCHSPTLELNRRSGRRWSAAQWQAWLEPHYLAMVSPTPPAVSPSISRSKNT